MIAVIDYSMLLGKMSYPLLVLLIMRNAFGFSVREIASFGWMGSERTIRRNYAAASEQLGALLVNFSGCALR